ncbi:hypothetical protein CLV78_101245 [Aliiruegeria haliotis]|uniref:Uncharacterized protein n=1 Tax=Aliiruegeria haliotis TaxID=1280846 RepID=A0A2T0RYA2_9RHOB|nr:hypothetical protein CLV78_101245 [Aliiruegeria haliotis]
MSVTLLHDMSRPTLTGPIESRMLSGSPQRSECARDGCRGHRSAPTAGGSCRVLHGNALSAGARAALAGQLANRPHQRGDTGTHTLRSEQRRAFR